MELMYWIFGGVLGLITMIGIFIILIIRSGKLNIDYVITQTFLEGANKTYFKKGHVDVLNDGSLMAVHKLGTAKNAQKIGTFHQKYMSPSRGTRYIMLLEEYDTGRFRPIVRKGLTMHTVKRAKTDLKGNYIRDVNANVIYEEVTEAIREHDSVPNEDIDFMLKEKEEYRQLLLRKEEKYKWLPMVASAFIFIILAIALVLGAFYLADYSKNLRTAVDVQGLWMQHNLELYDAILHNRSITEVSNPAPAEMGQPNEDKPAQNPFGKVMNPE